MNNNYLNLHDGRQLGYAEYGDLKGYPVLFFHGTPGSRLLFLEDDEISTELGIRLISFERPGYGLSTPKPGRTVLDWADDVKEAMGLLAIDSCSVIGVSGGGAYAASCAYKLPGIVRAAALISSVAPFTKGKPPKEMMLSNRIAFYLSRTIPWLLKSSYRAQKKMIATKPDRFLQHLRASAKQMNDWDRRFMQTDEQLRMFMHHLDEAFRHTVDECVLEPALLANPWGFSWADIQTPVYIWHGDQDPMAPCGEMKKAAEAIPNNKLTIVPGAGHFLTDDEQIWRDILTSITAHR